MDRPRVEELWSRFLSGAPLHPEEEAEIADALESDPRLLAELSQDLKIDRSLQGLGRSGRDADDFVNSFSYRLRTERDGTRFIATVKQKMKRSRKPSTRRWEQTAWPAARVGFAAAVLLAALGLILVASSPTRSSRKLDAARRPADRLEHPQPVEPRVPAPQPPRPERAPAPAELVVPPPAKTTPPLEPRIEKKEVPPPAPAPAVAENRDPARPGPTTVGTPARNLPAVGTLARVTGDVFVASPEGRIPVRPGQKLLAGQSIETAGPKGAVQLQFADGTKVDVGPDTLVSEAAEGNGTRGSGKRIALARGHLNVDVAKQPADQPLIVATPHGEAKVLGTVFRISVEPGPSGSMRLDVKEGRVRLTRASDLKALDVPAGCFATAGVDKGDLDLNGDNKSTLSFQDGVSPTPRYAGTSDAILVEAPKLAEKNTGAYALLWVDGDTTVGDDRYILLRWDLTGLPPRSTVISASIDVQVTNDSKGTVFELRELKRDWVEKETTWKLASAKVPWQTAGAQGVQDRGAAVLGVLSPRQAGLHTLKLGPDGIAAVQSWADAPATNHGLIIANSENQDAVGFHSREASIPALRPRLNVTVIPRVRESSSK